MGGDGEQRAAAFVEDWKTFWMGAMGGRASAFMERRLGGDGDVPGAAPSGGNAEAGAHGLSARGRYAAIASRQIA